MLLTQTPHAGAYGLIYADPPWRFATRSAKGVGRKSPEFHYPTATLADLCAMPVSEVAAPDAFLVMWTTWPMLLEAPKLAAAWGFPTYSTGGAWGKRSSTGRAWQFGTGYILRSASEPLLVFRRGRPKWESRSIRGFWEANVREHSRKPDEVRRDLELACPSVPRLEMFARQAAPGWDAWGNEIEKFQPVRRRRLVRAGT